MQAIPSELLNAIAVGIGIFIAFIGLQNIGLIVKNDSTIVSAGNITNTALIGLAGLLLIVILQINKIKGSLLIGILFSTILSIILGYTRLPDKLFSFNINIKPIFLKLDIIGALKFSFIAPIFSLMFMDLFDSIGSLLELAKEAGLEDKDGNIPKLDKLLFIDSGATMFGALCGTSTTTTYIESASGISSGDRTGLTSIVTGILFILAILFLPLIAIVPSYATAPALIMVGFFMMKNISKINFKNLEIGFPSFIIIIMIALSYSISYGLAFGFLSFSLIKIFRGKSNEIKIVMWIINILCVLFLIL